MNNEYFTAVFRVKDREQFMKFARQVSGSMCEGPDFNGSEVTGCGWGDSMTEADNMRQFLDDKGYDGQAIAEGRTP
ncbi:hypothetical protein M1D96_06345 [Pseudomonas sp. D1-3]